MKESYLRYSLWGIWGTLIACMGYATIIEKIHGKDYASSTVYSSWWFIALWAVLTVLSLVVLSRKKVYKRLSVILIHVAFTVMLLGACVTHFCSQSGTIHLREGEGVECFIDDDRMVKILPFTMTLRQFSVINYPASDAVMDYQCDIDVTAHNTTSPMTISMNNIGKADGYRFYQLSYDSDYRGTQLLVSYDPYGIAITYFGYALLLISLIWTMFSRHTRIRQLYREATRPLAVLLIAMMSADASAANPTVVSSEIASDFGKVVVLYNGRMCPINTAANEFVTKLCGKNTWQNYSADEIFVGWMVYYTEWETQPIIRVKNGDVQRLLGIEGQWASVRDFYTRDNVYKLSDKANDTSLSDATRKAIRETDEKIQVISMFYNSEMLHVFPLSVEGKTDWYTPGSTELPLGTPTAEFQFINHSMDHLVKSILVNDVEAAKLTIAKIRLYQKQHLADGLPSAAKVNMELLYNRLQSARWPIFICLTLSILFCLLMLAGKQGRVIRILHLTYILAQTLFLTSLMVLRWYISGHIPMSNGFETMLFMSWVTLIITLLIMHRIPVMKALGPVVSSFCMLVSMFAVGSPQITRLMPVLQSPLLTIHVALVMISYVLFFIITLIAVQCLVLQKKQLKSELNRMSALSQLLLYPAVSLLAIGIFIGAVWANISWGTYWSWDPKETWALITLLIYAVPLHRSVFTNNTSVRYHLYILLSFLSVIFTYFGVNYLLTGMHSYA